MEIEVKMPIKVNAKYLEVYFGGCFYPEDLCLTKPGETFCPEEFEEIEVKFPSLIKNDDFYLKIDLDNGNIVNFPEEWSGSFRTIKLVDEGQYRILNENSENIGGYDGYVPKILQIEDNGYGDYLEFVVKNGVIKNWCCNEQLLNEFFQYNEND